MNVPGADLAGIVEADSARAVAISGALPGPVESLPGNSEVLRSAPVPRLAAERPRVTEFEVQVALRE
jgi:hypothetical protein